ncbi:hypothetical protein SE19_03885 [Acidiplasma aeolicum]|uniref:Phospholipase D-like domain-containing protein n=1 Tax=Acidiplasma aeolicum TaxID=507754 RepID=A0A0P9CM25_9ARCH|nr:phospholipase D-like domain-containing protein [Acidiplasma aeolicum]KPV46803.1 hypothetical protein SE19_03885 [Acidiplasma aeolicum]KQB35832.1 hypothetical protein AOG54_02685 [Acidiplasma aeolicum]
MSYKLYVEPEDKYSKILDFIKKSSKYLYINYYLVDDQIIINEIKNAVSRSVDVRIIVDGRPYGINGDDGTHDEIKILKDTGAKVKIAPPRFERPNVFDHAKYMVTRGKCNIGTLNLTEAAFTKNREYGLIIKNKKISRDLKKLFLADWKNTDAGIKSRNLIISPGSQESILNFLKRERHILIESEEVGDDDAILNEFREKGKKLSIIVPSSVSSTDLKNLQKLSKSGVRVRYMPVSKLYMHAKLIIGRNEFFIGSENFTKASLNHNREVGILARKFFMVSDVKKIFKKDWKNASKTYEAAIEYEKKLKKSGDYEKNNHSTSYKS